jgi:transcriptional regulator with XRE-family HTH domain
VNKNLQIERVKAALKEIMRTRGYRYEDAAKALHVSLPTIRRWMSRGDLTLSQISDFANWLDLDFFELLDIAKRSAGRSVEFTDAQEEFFAANPKAILTFRMIAKGATIRDIEKKLGATSAQIQRQIILLERHDLISVLDKSRIKVKTTGPFKWKRSGPLEQAYLGKIVRVTADHVFQKACSGAPEQIENFETLFRPFEFRLQPNARKQLFKELNELVDKYSSVSKIDLAGEGNQSAREVTGILLGDEFSVWGRVLGEVL